MLALAYETTGRDILCQRFALSFEQTVPGLGALELVLHSTQGLSRWEDSFPILMQFIYSVKAPVRRSDSLNCLPQLLTSRTIVEYDVVAPSCRINRVFRVAWDNSFK